MCQELVEIDWESLFSNKSIDENWNLFKGEVLSVVSRHVPTISVSGSLWRFAIAGPYGKFCSWSDLFTYVFYCNA